MVQYRLEAIGRVFRLYLLWKDDRVTYIIENNTEQGNYDGYYEDVLANLCMLISNI